MPNDVSEPNKQLRVDAPTMSNKERKKELQKKAYKEKVAREAVEREAALEAARQLEIAQPEYPIRKFCLDMGTMPWDDAGTKWGYTNRNLKVAVLASPNDKLERVNNVPLAKGYTWADIAGAVEEAALDEDCGGNICDVTGAKLSADRITLEVEFEIYAFQG